MGTGRELKIRLQFGQAYWELLKFRSSLTTGDLCFTLPIRDVGLHLGIHYPKPPDRPDMHAHWRSHKLDIHEDVDARCLSAQYWINSIAEFTDSFKPYQPSDEDITVFHSILSNVPVSAKEGLTIDLEQITQTMNAGTFYQTKAKRLSSLLAKIQKKCPPSHTQRNFIWGLSEENTIIPINSDAMIEFDNLTVIEKWTNVFRPILDPLQKSLEVICRTRPDSFESWFPVADFEETLNNLDFKPKTVAF